jgi:hypothetical protein
VICDQLIITRAFIAVRLGHGRSRAGPMETPWQDFSNEKPPLPPPSLVSPPVGDNETLIWQSGDMTLPPLRSSDLHPSVREGPADWHSQRPFPPNHFELPPLDTSQSIQFQRRRSHLPDFELSGSAKRRRTEGGSFDREFPPPQTAAADSPSLLRPRAPLGQFGM